MTLQWANALLIHGAGGGAWEWNVWRRVLTAAGYAVVAPELQPVAGGLAATRFEDYLDQSIAAAAALSAPRVLVGASLGGLLALATAAHVDCAALVLVNPMPPAPETLAAREPYPDLVPWARDASLTGTRRALPDADEATHWYAWRRWRDESGAVLNAARAGTEVRRPSCPLLVIASEADEDVPVAVSAHVANRLAASLQRVPGSHVGPLLGRQASRCADGAVRWLNGLPGFRTD